MPPVDTYLALLRRAFDARCFSGNGPLVLELERRLAEYHGVRHCVAVANAGLDLVMLMRMFAGGRAGEVVMPAFGYNGLPHFAQWAGQMPRFCDVDAQTHGLDPRAVAQALSSQTTSILAVCNFHDAGAVEELCAVARAAGVPILFDSVNALGGTHRGRMLGSFGRAEVFSLHATKLLNGFEGGYITTDDAALANELRAQRDHARLNEVHAAMAIASLDDLDAVIQRNKARFDAYAEICTRLRGFELLRYRQEAGARHAFPLVVAAVSQEWPLTRDETVQVLRAEGAAIGAYYSPPLHRSAHAPPGLPVRTMPVSEALARRFVQLPAGELTSLDDIERIGGRLAFIQRHGAAIASRIRTGAPS